MAVHRLITAERIAHGFKAAGTVWMSDDDGSRGRGRLVLRVTPGGCARFYFRYRPKNKEGNKTTKQEVIGVYSPQPRPGYVTLEHARMVAAEMAASIFGSSRAEVHQHATTATGIKFLRLAEVLVQVPFSRATLWRMVRRGEFPAPVKMSPGVDVWPETVLTAWLAAKAGVQVVASAAPAPTAAEREAIGLLEANGYVVFRLADRVTSARQSIDKGNPRPSPRVVGINQVAMAS